MPDVNNAQHLARDVAQGNTVDDEREGPEDNLREHELV
jgi:hypothetical protein